MCVTTNGKYEPNYFVDRGAGIVIVQYQ